MKKLLIAALVTGFVTGTGAIPAQAQMDWLTPHLDAQRFGNQLRNNQRSAERARAKRRMRQADAMQPVRVKVNGPSYQKSVAGIKKNGTTFVPMREIFESLGATVEYDEQTRIVTAQRGSSSLQLPLQGGHVQVNDTTMTLRPSQTPFVHKGVTMVPLRVVAEGVGAQINQVPQKNSNLIEIAAR